jgi:poly(3-hydroxybutyrate) depolymerase
MQLKNRSSRLCFFIWVILIGIYLPANAQNITDNTTINLHKTWSQQPNGYSYPISIHVPSGPVPAAGFPVCILLHGNGGNGPGMVNDFSNKLSCHILVGPSGYLNSWNISNESSEAPDVEMVSDLLDSLKLYNNIDSTRIRLIGTSNGSALCNRVFIENKDPAIDIVCAIVSHLSTAQYHNNEFYYPSGATGGSAPYSGYDTPTTPIVGRKYLGISNTNDGLIPYNGGSSVGVTFLPAQESIFRIAQSQGYTGTQLGSNGTQLGNTNVYEYNYLNNRVVHLNGDAGHTTNQDQIDYLKVFIDDCTTNTAVHMVESSVNIYPNPTSDLLHIDLEHSKRQWMCLSNKTGQKLMTKLIEKNNVIDLSPLPSGLYFLQIGSNCHKISKQ